MSFYNLQILTKLETLFVSTEVIQLVNIYLLSLFRIVNDCGSL